MKIEKAHAYIYSPPRVNYHFNQKNARNFSYPSQKQLTSIHNHRLHALIKPNPSEQKKNEAHSCALPDLAHTHFPSFSLLIAWRPYQATAPSSKNLDVRGRAAEEEEEKQGLLRPPRATGEGRHVYISRRGRNRSPPGS